MLEILRSFSDDLYFYRFENKRAMSSEEADALCEEFGMMRVYNLTDTCAAYLERAGKNDVLLITGSLYLAAEAKQAVTEAFERIRQKEETETQ